MDIIRIGNDSLKITLGAREAEKYGFTYKYCNDNMKDGFLRLLVDAKEYIDYRAVDKKIVGEIFTGKDGVCEIFVSRVEEKVYKDRTQEAVLRNPRQIISVYSFNNLDNLLSVAKRLKSINYSGASSVYYDDIEENYYFLLEDVSVRELRFAFVLEYAAALKSNMIVHIKEHFKCIFKKDGVKRLAAF